MSRNYGLLSNVTSPTTVGGNRSSGSHLREELTRNSIIQLPDNPTSRQANSGRGNAAPFSLDVRELAAAVLVGIVATFAVGLPCVCFVLYYAFFE